MTPLFKNKITRFILPLLATLFFFSCQKDLSDTNVGGQGTIPDLATTVNSTISGFVTDESNTAVMGADVKAGGMSATTDKYGYFEIKNAPVVKSAAVVTVSKAGYFNGIKTYIAENNKKAFFRIKLLQKTNTGTIDAATGGSVTLSNGLIVALPVNGVVIASGGAAYTGAVNVAAHWIDPTAADISMTMPGDLRGLNTAGEIKTLTSFGMMAVELTSATGQLLQIAPGKKATLTFPIPASILGTAASSIPLWSFDEAKGLWKEEGSAIKTGNTYVGEVSHFSFWNCDLPADYVQFNCTVHDEAGNPIQNVIVKITATGTGPNGSRYGLTDSTGYVAGAVPDNSQLLLEIYSNYNCSSPVYTQTFTTNNVDVSLGTLTINTTTNAAMVSGTVTDCTNMPVTNGYIIMNALNGLFYRVPLSNTGSYSFSTLLCSSAGTVTMVAEDIATLQQSSPVTISLTPGANTIPNLQACGISVQQYITYTIDGGAPIEFSYPADSLMHNGSSGTTGISYISGSRMPGSPVNDYVGFSFPSMGMAVGSVQLLESFSSSAIGSQLTVTAPVNVNITEYGNIGEFVSGNFSGIVSSPAGPPMYTIVCSFRVRRNF